MSNEMNKLFGELNSAFEEFKKANDSRLDKIESQKYAPADLEEKVNRINSAIDTYQEKMDAVQAQMEKASALESLEKGLVSDAEKKAFDDFLRKGIEGKSINTGTPSEGGYAVPEGLVREFSRIQKETGSMRQLARVVQTGTSTWETVIGQNDAASGWTTETGARTTTTAPTVGNVNITAEEMYAKVAVTQKAIDDIFYNVEGEVMEDLRLSFDRLEQTAFTTGSGSGQPKGFLSYTKVATPGTAEWGKLNHILTASTDAIAGDDLIELVHTLEPAYRNGGAFQMNRGILADIRKLKGADNYYFWTPGLQAGAPSTILGYPVYENPFMAASHTNGGGDTDAIAFAQWNRFYVVVDRMGIRMLRDPYSNKPYVDFYATKRVGGGILDSKAGVVLTVNDS